MQNRSKMVIMERVIKNLELRIKHRRAMHSKMFQNIVFYGCLIWPFSTVAVAPKESRIWEINTASAQTFPVFILCLPLLNIMIISTASTCNQDIVILCRQNEYMAKEMLRFIWLEIKRMGQALVSAAVLSWFLVGWSELCRKISTIYLII